MEQKITYRVRMEGYGDGYEDFETLEEATLAYQDWIREYGVDSAKIEVITAKE